MVLFTLTLLLGTGWAAEPVDPFDEADESEIFRLSEELVTVASRYEQTVRKAPSIVSLVTADQIRERGYRTLSDVLRDLPGIYMWKSNEGRDLASFRGVLSADNNKLLLMVDGVPWYDGVYNHAFVGEYIPISHVRQVEVIKGPASAIYGTNAFAGVINVVTWDGASLDGARVRWSAGGQGRSDITGSAGGRSNLGGLEVEASAYVRLFEQSGEGIDLTPRGRVDALGEDPKQTLNAGLRVEVEGLELQLHHVDHRHSYLINETDNPWANLGKDIDRFGLYYHDTFFDARYNAHIGRDLTIRPHLWAQRHDNPGAYYYLGGFTTVEREGELVTEQHSTLVETQKDTRRWGAGVDVQARPSLDHVTVGGAGIENTSVLQLYDHAFVDGSHDWAEPLDFYADPATLHNAYAYAQHSWTALHYLEITGALRVDKRFPDATMQGDSTFRVFDPFLSARAGVLLIPVEAVTVKALYGRAFRAATIRELLVASDSEWSDGNKNLYPEHIDTVELEVTGVVGELLEARVDASWSRVGEEIDKFVVDVPGETNEQQSQYLNMEDGNLDILAAEAEATLQVEMISLRVAYAFTDARYHGGEYAGRRQYEFPAHMVKGRLGLHLTKQISAHLLGELYSTRYRRGWSPEAGMADGGAFGLMHLGARVADLGKKDQVRLDLSIRNLTDADWGTGMYRDDANVSGYDGPKYPYEIQGAGRSVVVGVEILL